MSQNQTNVPYNSYASQEHRKSGTAKKAAPPNSRFFGGNPKSDGRYEFACTAGAGPAAEGAKKSRRSGARADVNVPAFRLPNKFARSFPAFSCTLAFMQPAAAAPPSLSALFVGGEKMMQFAVTPEGDEVAVAAALETAAGRKRSATGGSGTDIGRKKARSSGAPEDKLGRDEDIDWRELVRLLQDASFTLGQRPDEILDDRIRPGLMFKEHPKRRREHSTTTRPMDKWYNTGGIKSASDRFLSDSEVGLRKRYGKVVRAERSVLRFHEYKLLQRPKSGEVIEAKLGPTLYRLVPENKRRQEAAGGAKGARLGGPPPPRAHLVQQQQEMERLRKSNAKLEKQLEKARKKIAKQAQQLSEYSVAATLLGPGSVLAGITTRDYYDDDSEDASDDEAPAHLLPPMLAPTNLLPPPHGGNNNLERGVAPGGRQAVPGRRRDDGLASLLHADHAAETPSGGRAAARGPLPPSAAPPEAVKTEREQAQALLAKHAGQATAAAAASPRGDHAAVNSLLAL